MKVVDDLAHNVQVVRHAIAEEPYAFMAFGPGSVFTPVIFTTPDYGVDAPVSVAKAGLSNIDVETSEMMFKMRESGLISNTCQCHSGFVAYEIARVGKSDPD